MKFKELALGARFKYAGGKDIWIVIDRAGCGIIAEYDPVRIKHKNWVGQAICSFSDTEEEMGELEVELAEV